MSTACTTDPHAGMFGVTTFASLPMPLRNTSPRFSSTRSGSATVPGFAGSTISADSKTRPSAVSTYLSSESSAPFAARSAAV